MGDVGEGNGGPMREDLRFLLDTVFMWIMEPQLLEPRGNSQLSSPIFLCYRWGN